VIYEQVFAKEDADKIWDSFLQNLTAQKIHWLLLTIFFIPINWAFETWKWQRLIKNFETLSFWKSYKAILAGVTFSLFTPNRIGEYGGRVLLVRPENNWKAVIATLVGSFSQIFILMSFGLVGMLFFIHHHMEMEQWIWLSILSAGVLLGGIMLICFYNIDLVIPIVRRIPFIHKIRPFVKNVSVLRNYSSRDLTFTLGFSFLRYCIYTLQYFFMLRFFGIDVSIFEGLMGISTIFFLQTSVPLPPIWDLFARGQIALQIWGIFSGNELAILASTFTLWILNLIIPALIGLAFIVQINVLQSLGYEKINRKNKSLQPTDSEHHGVH